jgi:hypothetical protein
MLLFMGLAIVFLGPGDHSWDARSGGAAGGKPGKKK